MYKKDTFDCVVTVYTLRNFADSQLAIWQMMRVLKPGGKLVVVDAFPPKIRAREDDSKVLVGIYHADRSFDFHTGEEKR